MTMTDLLPCPFCRGSAKLNSTYANQEYYIQCNRCLILYDRDRNGYFKSEKEVVDKWNTRDGVLKQEHQEPEGFICMTKDLW